MLLSFYRNVNKHKFKTAQDSKPKLHWVYNVGTYHTSTT